MGSVTTVLRPPDHFTWLQLNVIWWPVSPIGYIMASSWAMDNILWGAALIGWLIVSTAKHFGGLPLYRRLRPAFIGLVIGSYVGGGVFGLLTTFMAYGGQPAARV